MTLLLEEELEVLEQMKRKLARRFLRYQHERRAVVPRNGSCP